MDNGFAWRMWGPTLALAATVAAGSGLPGCKCARSQPAGPGASASSGMLKPELASKVLAQVGDRTITLGDYAAALERMDRFERIRYQTPERRKLLLDEMIGAELLAAEARRRGLDREPMVQARVRQAMRDALLAEVHRKVPGPEEIPEEAVRAYYGKHRADFFTPERRRLSAVVTRERGVAEQVLEKARGTDSETWGRLVERYSVRPDANDATDAGLRGDLGFVAEAVKDSESGVPAAVRAAAFQIGKQGDVFDGVIDAEGEFYVIRLVAKVEAGHRAYAEAERSIRVTLSQRALREAEAALEAELRKKYPVEIDEAALKQVRAPAGND
jgi:peptidyl-prolyl cis-trans isomerase C